MQTKAPPRVIPIPTPRNTSCVALSVRVSGSGTGVRRAEKSSRWSGGITAEEMSTLIWVKPTVVVQIRFVEWTAQGRRRHASYLGLRPDKDARQRVARLRGDDDACATLSRDDVSEFLQHERGSVKIDRKNRRGLPARATHPRRG